MAIDISSIIQNHLTEESNTNVEEGTAVVEEGTTTVVEEGATSNGLGVNFEDAVNSMGSGSTEVVTESEDMFMSETEIEAVRGAIVSGIIAANV